MICPDTLDSAVCLRFFDRLAKASGKKVFLIVDNVRVHYSAPVKQWLAANVHRIALYFLPSYSPERNLERVMHFTGKVS